MESPELAQLVAELRATKISGDQPIEEMRVSWDKFATAFPPAPDLSFASVAAGGPAPAWAFPPRAGESRPALDFLGGGDFFRRRRSIRQFRREASLAAVARSA